jgi:uncharacterized membrane protein
VHVGVQVHLDGVVTDEFDGLGKMNLAAVEIDVELVLEFFTNVGIRDGTEQFAIIATADVDVELERLEAAFEILGVLQFVGFTLVAALRLRESGSCGRSRPQH